MAVSVVVLSTPGEAGRGDGGVDELRSSWQRLKTTKGEKFTEPPGNWKIKAKGSFSNKNCREINYLGAFLNSEKLAKIVSGNLKKFAIQPYQDLVELNLFPKQNVGSQIK